MSGATNISSCQTISDPGEYVLNQSISNSSTCITIESSDVIFDGAGYNITGPGGSNYGIYVYNGSTTLTNVTVKNLNVTDWYRGIYYRNTENGSITNNNASNNTYGIFLRESSNNTIKDNNQFLPTSFCRNIIRESSNNTIKDNNVNSNNWEGIVLAESSNNIITNNTANSNNHYGIYLMCSEYNDLTNNKISNNSYGIYLDIECGPSEYNLISNNTASNNDYGIYLAESSNNIITNNNASNNDYGISLDSSSNNTLTGNTMSANTYNFWIEGEYSNTIDTSNTVDGKPIYYLVGQSNVVVNSSTNAGFVGAVNSDNITVEGLTLTKNNHGVLFYNTNNSRIEHVNVSNNNEYGIYLLSSSGNTIANNTANSNNGYGIRLYYSSDNTLTSNSMTDNTYNFYLSGSQDSHFTNSINESNTVDGKPILYIKNGANTTYDSSSNAGVFYCIWCNNVTVKDLTLTKNGYGVFFWSTNNSKIENVNASNNDIGIYLYSNSNYNTLTGNTASNNNRGIYLYKSSSNTFRNNTLSISGSQYGFYFSNDASLNNDIDATNKVNGASVLVLANVNTPTIVTGNFALPSKVYATNRGLINLYQSSNITIRNVNVSNNNQDGIYLYDSDNNTLTDNNASNNGNGIRLRSSSNNTLTDNTANSNDNNGIHLWSSSSNTIYNNLFNNTNNFYLYSSTNYWNTTKTPGTNIVSGPYLGGNFWTKPDGTGFSETCADANGDGICDSVYTLASGNVDYLPLTFTVTPETTFNITLLQGWNLISIPLVQENTSIDAVLASIDGNYTAVYAWIDGSWKWSTALFNPLTEMDLEHGYWINMTAPGTLELSGTVPASTTINISTGWNLVGYPSLTSENLTTVLSPINYTAVYAWINGSWKWSTALFNPLTEMSPGYGYWINATGDGSYEVGN